MLKNRSTGSLLCMLACCDVGRSGDALPASCQLPARMHPHQATPARPGPTPTSPPPGGDTTAAGKSGVEELEVEEKGDWPRPGVVWLAVAVGLPVPFPLPGLAIKRKGKGRAEARNPSSSPARSRGLVEATPTAASTDGSRSPVVRAILQHFFYLST